METVTVIDQSEKSLHVRMDRRILYAVIALLAAVLIILVAFLAVESTKKKDCSNTDSGKSSASQARQSASGHYRYAAVTADNDLCSKIGTDMMARRGGSAVDGALATVICLGVINQQHVGIGGGHVMVVYEKPVGQPNREMKSLVAIGTAPLWAKSDYFENDPAGMNTGPMSIAVPCEIKGYYSAWERYHRVTWKELFQPSIELCRNGWNVSESMALSIKNTLKNIKNDALLREAFLRPDGKPYEAGDLMTNEKLGNSLEKIAASAEDFYDGELANDIVADIADAGGAIDHDDLASASTLWWPALEASLANNTLRLFTPPPPSSGASLALIMKMLDNFSWTEAEASNNDAVARAEALKKFIRTWSIAFHLREEAIGDRAFLSREMKQWLDAFVSDEFTKELVNQMQLSKDDEQFTLQYLRDLRDGYGKRVKRSSETHKLNRKTRAATTTRETVDIDSREGTSHVNVLSGDGSAVAITTTVGSLFGARIRGNRTGIIFNNGLSQFNLPVAGESTVNIMSSRKRGRSSMSPFIILDKNDNVVLMSGSSGGSRILTSATYVTAHALFLNTGVTLANGQPRIHSEFNSSIYYDEGVPNEVLELLRKSGYEDLVPSEEMFPYLGVNQILDNRACIACGEFCYEPCIEGVSDWRKGGKPDGY